MTRLVFVVDHIFRTGKNGDVYTMGGKFPYKAWASYIEIFDEIVVISRAKEIEPGVMLSLSSGPKLNFVFVDGRRGLSRIFAIKKNAEIIQREILSADVVIARLPSELGLIASNIAKKIKKPYLIEVVACPWDALWNHGSIAPKLYAPVLWWRTRRAVWSAPIVRYVTKNFLQRRYPTTGTAFVASNVELASSPQAVRFPAAPSNDTPIVFGTIGALHTKLKGIQTAISALGEMVKSNPEISFEYRILGEGDTTPYASQARDLGISDRVHFDGTRRAGAEVQEWLDGIDVYLQPSFQEGLPRALIEAMARGKISIGSSAGGTPELLKENRIHSPGDQRQLKKRIDAVIQMTESQRLEESKMNMQIASQYAPDVIYHQRLNSLVRLREMTNGEQVNG